MRKPSTNVAPPSPWDAEVRLLAWLATCVSVFSFLFYLKRGEVLLYGDAIAHINIARRVFDSRSPGLLQLGTVWLPLPHLLMIPFIYSKSLWQSGAGGSVPSMIAYVFGVVGIFRLTRGALSRGTNFDRPASVAAWIAAVIYAANPNLIYMQSTAMGEPLYLAFFIWAVVFFIESRGSATAFIKSALCLAAACLTRYDGWFLAVAMSAAVVVGYIVRALRRDRSVDAHRRQVGRGIGAVLAFVLIAGASPALWLVYNSVVFGNALEFENGPYSAKAIEQKGHTSDVATHPGTGNPVLAELCFLVAAEENLAQNVVLQGAWFLVAVFALAGAGYSIRYRGSAASSDSAAQWLPLGFLLMPLPIYALSVAYGGVPIFVPNWWMHSYYNVRYGLQLLPAFSLAPALLVYFVLRWDFPGRRARLAGALTLSAFVVASYASVWRATPICLEEALVNSKTRNQLQTELAGWLGRLPPDATILMVLGDQGGALERAGIPLKHTFNECTPWEGALANPAKYVDYVVALQGDSVWQAVHGMNLPEVVEIHVTEQPNAIIYRAR